METELVEIHNRSNRSHDLPPTPLSPTDGNSTNSPKNSQNDHHNSEKSQNSSHKSHPFYHPRFQQEQIHTSEDIHHFDDFKSLIQVFWKSFLLTMHGLFIRTPLDFKNETKYFYHNPMVFITELLCGLTMSIIVFPESIGFTDLVGLHPKTGLISGMIICMACAIFGARPAMISGAAASTFSILGTFAKNEQLVKDFTEDQRHDIIFFCVGLSGCIQILFSVLHLAPYFIKLMPHSVMIGFVNALAVAILRSQSHLFERCPKLESPPGSGKFIFVRLSQCPKDDIYWLGFGKLELWLVFILLAVSLVIMFTFQKIPYVGKIIPPSLVVFIVSSFIEQIIFRKGFGVSTPTLKETTDITEGSFMRFHIPKIAGLPKVPWGNIILYSLYVAFVGTLESLLCLVAMNQRLKERSTDQALNREAFGQGIGQIIAGFGFSAIGGCATIGESLLNIESNARHRLSAFFSACVTIIIILWAAPLVNLIPQAALAAVIVAITFHTFYWPTFIIIWFIRKADVFIILVVTFVSIFTNLGIGTLIGVLIAAITLVLDSFHSFRVEMVDLSIPIPNSQKSIVDDYHSDGIDNSDNNDDNDDTNQSDNGEDHNTSKNTIPQNEQHSTPTTPKPDDNSQLLTTDIQLQVTNLSFDNVLHTPPGNLFSPSANETTNLNTMPFSSPITEAINIANNIQGENGMMDQNGDSKQDATLFDGGKGQVEDDLEHDTPMPNFGIYIVPDYKIIDDFICYHYIPPTERIGNPTVLPSSKKDHIDHQPPISSRNSPSSNPNEVPKTIHSDDSDDSDDSDASDEENDQHIQNVDQKSPTIDPKALFLEPITENNTLDDLYMVTGDDIINENAVIANLRLYRLTGTLFFGSVRAVSSEIFPTIDPEFNILDFNEVLLTDYSSSTSLVTLLSQYSDLNKRCKLVHVNGLQAKKTILRDHVLRKMLSRVDKSTYIVLTAHELKIRKAMKLHEKELKKGKGEGKAEV
jgi:SulP family sulfate permease